LAFSVGAHLVLRFVARRILEAIPLLLGVAVLSFVFMQLAPGGPDALFARNGRMSAEQLANIRHSMGLDRPPHEQLLTWILNILRGNLGVSYSQFRPVSDVIREVFPNTVILMGAGLLISLVAALVFGILAARRPYGVFDNLTSFISYFGLAMPVFWFGLMLQLLFAVRLGWLPSAGMYSPQAGGLGDLLKHLVLPALTIGIGSIAGWSRYVRSSTVEQLSQDYVRSARSKGLPERRVMTAHVLRNSLIPLVTVVGIDVPLYLTGAVLTETVFSWPGMGRLFFDALSVRDYPILMGILVLGAILIILGNLVADILYGLLDPRISYR
jgi:peptide/nickel transport system permease protein